MQQIVEIEKQNRMCILETSPFQYFILGQRKIKYTFFATFFLFGLSGYGQSPDELEKRHGFKDIRLESEVEAYPELEYKREIKDDVFPGAVLYVNKKGSYTDIGGIRVYDVEVKTYKGQIYEIRVVTDKDPNLRKGLDKAFGEAYYDFRSQAYIWNSKSVRLQFKPESKTRLELVYYSHAMEKVRKEEKKDKIEDVSDDF